MRIALFGYEGNPLSLAAEGGLRRLGHDVIYQAPNCFSPTQPLRNLDGVVVTEMRGGSGEAARFYSARGLPVVAIDQPHLRRDEKRWLRVTPPQLDWLPEYPDGEDVPTDRLDMLGIELKSRKRVKAQKVLVAGQRSGDPTHGLSRSQFERWAIDTLKSLRRVYDGEVVWRPHPRDVYAIPGFDAMSDPREESLQDALEGAWLLVTHSSTSGLDALIEGLPVIAEGKAVYREVSGSLDRWKDLKAPAEEDLRRLLAKIAYTQFTVDEVRSGAPFAAFFPDAVEAASPSTKSTGKSAGAEPRKAPSEPASSEQPATGGGTGGEDGGSAAGGERPAGDATNEPAGDEAQAREPEAAAGDGTKSSAEGGATGGDTTDDASKSNGAEAGGGEPASSEQPAAKKHRGKKGG